MKLHNGCANDLGPALLVFFVLGLASLLGLGIFGNLEEKRDKIHVKKISEIIAIWKSNQFPGNRARLVHISDSTQARMIADMLIRSKEEGSGFPMYETNQTSGALCAFQGKVYFSHTFKLISKLPDSDEDKWIPVIPYNKGLEDCHFYIADN